MGNDILRRIERIEKKNTAKKPPAVFFSVQDEPVRGWKFDDQGKEVQIMREMGEDDDTLDRRTIEAARAVSGRNRPLPWFWCVREAKQ